MNINLLHPQCSGINQKENISACSKLTQSLFWKCVSTVCIENYLQRPVDRKCLLQYCCHSWNRPTTSSYCSGRDSTPLWGEKQNSYGIDSSRGNSLPSLPNSLSRSLFHNCSVFPLREGLSLSHCSSYLWSACFKSDSSIGGGTFDPLDAGGNFRCKLSRHISRRGFGSALNMPKCFLFGLCLSIEDVRDLYSQYSWRVYFFILTNYLNQYFNLHVKMKTSRVVSWLRHAA